MKRIWTVCSLVVVAGLVGWTGFKKPNNQSYPQGGRNVTISMCGSFLFPDSTLAPARILSGLGVLHYKISTNSPKAQEFFDQGLRLMYGYNHWEALRSFKEAARLDPACGMAYWGMALSLGPYINDPNPKDREKMAFDAIQKAKTRGKLITQQERDFIDALSARFNGKAYDNRDSLNQSYYRAMSKLAKKYPDDPEVQTLFADAMMSMVPWQWWDLRGNPKPQTVEARPVLENILKKFPNHPGANHLYIHLMEESPTPEVANASALFLETALPAAGHLVHMPGHIYQRIGDYQRSIETNIKAVIADEIYLAESLTEDYGLYRAAYHPHNIDFICYSSYMTGQSDLGIRSASKLVFRARALQSMMPPLYEYILSEPLTAYIRFGKWNDILALSLPDKTQVGALILWRYARGLAYLRKDYLTDSRREWHQLDSLSRLPGIGSMITFYNSFGHMANIANHALKGEILIKEKKLDQGLKELKSAVASEDTLMYNEPPDWRNPTRHLLGAAQLEAGRYKDAEQTFLEDLKINRNNGWALQGLMQSQLKLGKTEEAKVTAAQFEKAWRNADVKITSSRF